MFVFLFSFLVQREEERKRRLHMKQVRKLKAELEENEANMRAKQMQHQREVEDEIRLAKLNNKLYDEQMQAREDAVAGVKRRYIHNTRGSHLSGFGVTCVPSLTMPLPLPAALLLPRSRQEALGELFDKNREEAARREREENERVKRAVRENQAAAEARERAEAEAVSCLGFVGCSAGCTIHTHMPTHITTRRQCPCLLPL